MEGEGRVLSAAEAAEFGEFQRRKRETEVSLTLKRLIVDASRREVDKLALKRACESAEKLGAETVLVSPVNVSSASRMLEGKKVRVCALVGGSGESLTVIKKQEAKRAARQGAKEIRLVLCYCALFSEQIGYLKREVKRVRRAVKRCAFSLSLEDHSLGISQIASAVKVAVEAGCNGVTVRGELPLVECALEASGGKLNVECSGVENSEQLRLLVKAGVVRATTRCGEEIAQEMYSAVREADERTRNEQE